MNFIGLDQAKSDELALALNDLLANYQLYYQNLRGFHWNIKGPQFFELHAKFEELYTEAQEQIDEIAERILTLGATPIHSFGDYLAKAEIEPAVDVFDAENTVSITLKNIQTLISKERAILELAGEADDEGTSTLVGDYISGQEKTAWMLNAYLG
ncbi:MULTISPECIES: Dps family protein [Persicobacter]|uniref:DNA starvation/stationary phase protection protein n=1 Tax=Persicobacter diffluens TaxID=981 RepID=A0AAN4VVH4_9BACT|nr:DNA starvation/stationary phase protection protein [Persicobacter sp. CCB-QB2]GJM59821.1 DNA starvation/stationary phase protection protein [Persicobacter diffluens]